jgi:pimeloyl-ACP methyl ester carboxylesterase
VSGSGDVALVFVHCWCCNKGFWDGQVPYFSKKYKVVSLDLPGHGDSGSNRDAWTMKAFGEDVAVVVNELKLKKVILIGHSMGGAVVAYAAGMLGDKVAGVIGVDTFLNVELKLPEEQLKQILGAFKNSFEDTTKKFVSQMFPKDTNPEIKKKIIDTMASANNKMGIGTMESMYKMDFAKVVKDANINIRCINADMFKAQNNVEANKRHAKSFEVTFMENTGHFLHMEKPEEFNKLLEKYIEELLAL